MMARQLLWVVLALLALPVLLVFTAPELLQADVGEAFGLLGVVLAAGVPGLLLLGIAAVRRQRDLKNERD